MPEQTVTSEGMGVYDQEWWSERGVSRGRSEVRCREVPAYITKKYDRREGRVDAGAKWEVREWQRLWSGKMTRERGEWMPERSRRPNVAACILVDGRATKAVGECRTEAEHPEVEAYIWIDDGTMKAVCRCWSEVWDIEVALYMT